MAKKQKQNFIWQTVKRRDGSLGYVKIDPFTNKPIEFNYSTGKFPIYSSKEDSNPINTAWISEDTGDASGNWLNEVVVTPTLYGIQRVDDSHEAALARDRAVDLFVDLTVGSSDNFTPWGLLGQGVNYGLGTVMEQLPEPIQKTLEYGKYLSPSYLIDRYGRGLTELQIMNGEGLFGTGTGTAFDMFSAPTFLNKAKEELTKGTPYVVGRYGGNTQLGNWGRAYTISRMMDADIADTFGPEVLTFHSVTRDNSNMHPFLGIESSRDNFATPTPTLSIDNLAIQLRNRGFNRKQIHRIIEDIANRYELNVRLLNIPLLSQPVNISELPLETLNQVVEELNNTTLRGRNPINIRHIAYGIGERERPVTTRVEPITTRVEPEVEQIAPVEQVAPIELVSQPVVELLELRTPLVELLESNLYPSSTELLRIQIPEADPLLEETPSVINEEPRVVEEVSPIVEEGPSVPLQELRSQTSTPYIPRHSRLHSEENLYNGLGGYGIISEWISSLELMGITPTEEMIQEFLSRHNLTEGYRQIGLYDIPIVHEIDETAGRFPGIQLYNAREELRNKGATRDISGFRTLADEGMDLYLLSRLLGRLAEEASTRPHQLTLQRRLTQLPSTRRYVDSVTPEMLDKSKVSPEFRLSLLDFLNNRSSNLINKIDLLKAAGINEQLAEQLVGMDRGLDWVYNLDKATTYLKRINEYLQNPNRTRLTGETPYTIEEIRNMYDASGKLKPEFQGGGYRVIKPGSHGSANFNSYYDTPTVRTQKYLRTMFGNKGLSKSTTERQSVSYENPSGSGLYIPEDLSHHFSIDSARMFISMLKQELLSGRRIYRPENAPVLPDSYLNHLGQANRYKATYTPEFSEILSKATDEQIKQIIDRVTDEEGHITIDDGIKLDGHGNVEIGPVSQNRIRVGKLVEKSPEEILRKLNSYVRSFNQTSPDFKLHDFVYRNGTFYLPDNIGGAMIYKKGGKSRLIPKKGIKS